MKEFQEDKNVDKRKNNQSAKKKAKIAKKIPYQVGDIISANPKLFDEAPGSFSKES
jgi:hypothetical protein